MFRTIPTCILDILVSYIDPINLHQFFLTQCIDVNTSFVYDAYDYPLNVKIVKSTFCMFPNIKLVGLDVEGFDDTLGSELLHIWIDKSDNINLEKYTKLSDVVISNSTFSNTSINIGHKLKHIEFYECYLFGLHLISSQTLNLTHMMLTSCTIEGSILSAILECPTLSILSISDCYIPDSSTKTFSSNTIKKFTLYETIDIFLKYTWIFPNCEKANLSFIHSEDISGLTTWSNLKYLKLRNCSYLTHFDHLTSLPNLRSIQVSGLHAIPNWQNLAKIYPFIHFHNEPKN